MTPTEKVKALQALVDDSSPEHCSFRATYGATCFDREAKCACADEKGGVVWVGEARPLHHFGEDRLCHACEALWHLHRAVHLLAQVVRAYAQE